MIDSQSGKISFKQAIYLALTVLCLYYPITIAANIPLAHWKNVQFLVLPAVVHFVFYALLIIAIDRIIDRLEQRIGPDVLELRIATIGLSIIVAVIAVIMSQLLFKMSSRVWLILNEYIEREEVRGFDPRPRLLLWNAVGRANYALTFVISISIFYLILNRKSHFKMRSWKYRHSNF